MNRKIRTVLLFLGILGVLFVLFWFISMINPGLLPFRWMILLGYTIPLPTAVMAWLFGKGRSQKTKYLVWGTAVLLPVSTAPLVYSLACSYEIYVKKGSAPLNILYLLLFFIMAGLVLLSIGLLKKNR